MTGAWRLLASRQVVWVPGVPLSTLHRRMWPVSPPAANCAASSGRTLTPSTLMTGATLPPPRAPSGASSRPVPTFTLRVIHRGRSLCLAKSRPGLCLAFSLTPPSLAIAGSGLPPVPLPLIPMSIPIFRTALQRRLRMPLWDHDSACSMCGEVLDRWQDHALSCSCGGDKVRRHNAIREVVCAAVSEFTSVSPEVEKPGLLILVVWTGPRFPPGFPPPSAAGRRLADVWVPRDVSGFAEAWDFSVSSLLRTSHLSTASPTVAGVFHEVEARKCALEWLGLPPSHALPEALPLICLETLASGLLSASAAPFTGKMRAQS